MSTQVDHRDGLEFKKLDLHIHTPASACFGDRGVTAEQIVAAALKQELRGIAVTDHNSGAWIDDIKNAANAKLVVFPGVELTCDGGKEGIHMIALFDPSTGTKDVESLLGNLGLTPAEYGNVTTVIHKAPIEIAAIIRERGGLVVLAHANSSKGVLQDMAGQQRIQLLQCADVAAAEGTDFQDATTQAKHKRVVDLLDGTDPNYQRKLAVYQASDNPSGDGDGKHGLAGIGTRCSYFKLDRIDIRGLTQCFADPDVRIRQDYENKSTVYPLVRSIKITGGFLDGQTATFHGGLNSVIGAKGTGKSLLVEFLRFGLNQPPTNEGVLADHDAKLEARLETYGSVELTLSDDLGQTFTVTRTLDPADDSPFADGRADIDQLFPALFLSQNEIIKIAENEAEQIAFIDRFIDFKSHQDTIRGHERDLAGLDADLAEAFRAYPEVQELTKALKTIQAEVEHLDKALTNPTFDKFAQHEDKDRAIRAQCEFISSQVELVDGFIKEAAVTPPVLSGDLAKDPVLKRLFDLSNSAKSDTTAALQEMRATLKRRVGEYNAEYAKWAPVLAAARKAYDDAVKAGGGDYKILAQKRAKKMSEGEVLRQKLARMQQKSDRIADVNRLRNEALNRLKAARDAFSVERAKKCAAIETEANRRLQVRIKEASNVEEFRRRLMLLKKGSYLKDSEIEVICVNTDSETFIRAVLRRGVFGDNKTLDELAVKFKIDVQRIHALADFLCTENPAEKLLALQYKGLPADRPEILYNVGQGGQDRFEPLKRLSVGQKCTAMLVIALSDGSVPIVIDQPEDSLDIRSIWDDMCRKIRDGKEKRQFIFTTHNSSLAVASDTDKYIVMEADALHGKIVFSGSMDHSPMREEVMKYLEGGPDTYRMKYGKYRGRQLP